MHWQYIYKNSAYVLAVVCTDVPDSPKEGAASQPVSGQGDDTCAAEFAE